jgi:hypothetical protein
VPSASQEIPHLLWAPTVHCMFARTGRSDLQPLTLKIHFNIIFPFVLALPRKHVNVNILLSYAEDAVSG